MIFCRCFKYKEILAYKEMCGRGGYTEPNTRFLREDSAQVYGGACQADATYTWTFDRITCADNFVSSGDPDNIFCDGGGTPGPVTNTYKEVHGDQSCCTGHDGYQDGMDSYTLSNQYTKEMLAEDVDALLDSVEWSELDWGQSAEPLYNSEGGIDKNINDGLAPPAVAVFYTNDVDNPTWMQKSRIRFTPTGSKYCAVFYPQDGSACSQSKVDCTPGEEVTVEPPETPGYKVIQQCCDPEGPCAS